MRSVQILRVRPPKSAPAFNKKKISNFLGKNLIWDLFVLGSSTRLADLCVRNPAQFGAGSCVYSAVEGGALGGHALDTYFSWDVTLAKKFIIAYIFKKFRGNFIFLTI